MGWFDFEKKDKKGLYSDETLDLAFQFIENFSKAYVRDLKRKPTIEELEFLIDLSFNVNVDDRYLENFNERKIESVKFKTGKRKKRIKYEVGDICAVPLKKGGFVFTRILLLTKPNWYLSEIYAYFSKDKVYYPDIKNKGDLLYPMFITPNDYDDWNAEIVSKKTDGILDKLKSLKYYYGLPGNFKLVDAGNDESARPISDEEAEKYAKVIFYMPNDILKMIENQLDKME